LSSAIKQVVVIFSTLAVMLSTVIAIAQNAASADKQRSSAPPPRPPVLPPQLMPPHPADKMEQRYFDIDAKRATGITSEDMLPRSREFKRIDSTYYVGWMIEGQYKFDHAADYLGFKNAIVPLERAMQLMDHDYAKALATRTDQPLVFYPIRMIRVDYTMIAYYLMQCYSNTDQPDKVYALLRHVLKWKFQADFYLDTYDLLGWTVHRNRLYTSAKYPFLKNSIDANEKLAGRYLDSSLIMIAKNKQLNDGLATIFPFMKDVESNEKLSVYHYKNILCSYSFQIDSAFYYFELMRKAHRLPHNNYANFLGICGDFRTAEAEYNLAADQDGQDHRLQEWAYYSSIIDIYKSKPKSGISMLKDMIRANGTTPGYGWYNIALARCMLYDGQIAEAQRYADRAANFKELHIGTTLGQTQYDFSVQLIKLINNEQSWQMSQFEHSNWWYNLPVLGDMAKKLSEKYLQQFLIINQFAQNPERDRVIYKLFSTESTVSWDEIYYLIHDFSTRFFVGKFSQEAQTDNRKNIRKYFELVTARLKLQQGKYSEAKKMLDDLLHDPNTDQDYEKLFIARIYQAEAECAKAQNNTGAQNEWLYKLYVLYPQLVPFTGMQMNMNLTVSGNIDKAVIERLKACNINWVTNSSIPSANVYIIGSGSGNKKDITYYVLDRTGNYIVPKQAFSWQKAEETGTALAYRLFNIGNPQDENVEKK
jgi:hypothetical protein